MLVIWQCGEEIVRHISLMVIEVLLLNDTGQVICGGFVVVTITYVEQTFFSIFRILQ